MNSYGISRVIHSGVCKLTVLFLRDGSLRGMSAVSSAVGLVISGVVHSAMIMGRGRSARGPGLGRSPRPDGYLASAAAETTKVPS